MAKTWDQESKKAIYLEARIKFATNMSFKTFEKQKA